MTTPSLKIPAIIWESLEISLMSSSKIFIKKAAQILHVEEKELLRAVMPPGDTIKMILYETEDIRKCQAWISNPAKSDFAIRCKKAIIPGEEYCSIHKHCRPDVQNCIEGTKDVDPIITPPDVPSLWLIPDTSDVINSEGKIVGKFHSENNSIEYFLFQRKTV